MLFDLDDTLLNRDKAVEKMFLQILEKCYGARNSKQKTTCYNHSKNMIKEAMAIVIKQKCWNLF